MPPVRDVNSLNHLRRSRIQQFSGLQGRTLRAALAPIPVLSFGIDCKSVHHAEDGLKAIPRPQIVIAIKSKIIRPAWSMRRFMTRWGLLPAIECVATRHVNLGVNGRSAVQMDMAVVFYPVVRPRICAFGAHRARVIFC